MGKKRAPNAVDRHVGQRIRIRRMQLGINQTKLAHAIGVTFQQVQKYEKGTNRISIGALSQIAAILGTTVPFLLKDAPKLTGLNPLASEAGTPLIQDVMATPLGLRLNQAFAGINSKRIRHSVVDLLEQISVTAVLNDRRR